MESKKLIDVCDFCTSIIKLNIELLADFDSTAYLQKRKMLFENIRSKYPDLLLMSDDEIQKYLSSVYTAKIDNDKYGKNNLRLTDYEY